MYKHILYFTTLAECLKAETWIKATYGSEIEDSYTDDDDPHIIHFCFYTSNPLLMHQQQNIISSLHPTNYRINEEL
ncbi:MAG TPA: hypothetical protein VHV10_17890 [Ktedonobacteraceae bacterium]|jgi:hypothetical protein|nr:hypothetical protein [Ktedonobacteraceae bacterium]